MYQGYDFYIDGYLLPITPPTLDIKIGSNNTTVNLINGGDINILKSPKLIEVTFEARFPMREYPYTKANQSFSYYFDHFKALKEGKSPFQFIVARATPKGQVTWDTNLTVAIEEMTIQEDADEGDDVIIKFELKQWKSYGTKTVKLKTSSGNTVTGVTQSTRPVQTTAQATEYTVKNGDTLWAISKKMYGDGAQWPTIYEANKSTIESTAQDHGLNSSSNGHWIWSGTTLTIPETPSSTATATGNVTWNSTDKNYQNSDGTILAGAGANASNSSSEGWTGSGVGGGGTSGGTGTGGGRK